MRGDEGAVTGESGDDFVPEFGVVEVRGEEGESLVLEEGGIGEVEGAAMPAGG